jgi:hypothetical protein
MEGQDRATNHNPWGGRHGASLRRLADAVGSPWCHRPWSVRLRPRDYVPLDSKCRFKFLEQDIECVIEATPEIQLKQDAIDVELYEILQNQGSQPTLRNG